MASQSAGGDRSSCSVRCAKVTFLTTTSGGRRTAPASGVHPQIKMGEIYSSCVVNSTRGLTTFPLGEEVDVEIKPMFPEAVGETFAGLALVELYEGSRLVAVGVFTD